LARSWGDESLKRRFVETTKEFQEKKLLYADIFKAYDEIEKEITGYLWNISWHNLEKVMPLYQRTLGIDFPGKETRDKIFVAILKRHDIIHRNGKTEEGEEHLITRTDVQELIKSAETLARHIARQLKPPTEESDLEENDVQF